MERITWKSIHDADATGIPLPVFLWQHAEIEEDKLSFCIGTFEWLINSAPCAEPPILFKLEKLVAICLLLGNRGIRGVIQPNDSFLLWLLDLVASSESSIQALKFFIFLLKKFDVDLTSLQGSLKLEVDCPNVDIIDGLCFLPKYFAFEMIIEEGKLQLYFQYFQIALHWRNIAEDKLVSLIKYLTALGMSITFSDGSKSLATVRGKHIPEILAMMQTCVTMVTDGRIVHECFSFFYESLMRIIELIYDESRDASSLPAVGINTFTASLLAVHRQLCEYCRLCDMNCIIAVNKSVLLLQLLKISIDTPILAMQSAMDTEIVLEIIEMLLSNSKKTMVEFRNASTNRKHTQRMNELKHCFQELRLAAIEATRQFLVSFPNWLAMPGNISAFLNLCKQTLSTTALYAAGLRCLHNCRPLHLPHRVISDYCRHVSQILNHALADIHKYSLGAAQDILSSCSDMCEANSFAFIEDLVSTETVSLEDHFTCCFNLLKGFQHFPRMKPEDSACNWCASLATCLVSIVDLMSRAICTANGVVNPENYHCWHHASLLLTIGNVIACYKAFGVHLGPRRGFNIGYSEIIHQKFRSNDADELVLVLHHSMEATSKLLRSMYSMTILSNFLNRESFDFRKLLEELVAHIDASLKRKLIFEDDSVLFGLECDLLVELACVLLTRESMVAMLSCICKISRELNDSAKQVEALRGFLRVLTNIELQSSKETGTIRNTLTHMESASYLSLEIESQALQEINFLFA